MFPRSYLVSEDGQVVSFDDDVDTLLILWVRHLAHAGARRPARCMLCSVESTALRRACRACLGRVPS